jgi:hypothetical protein
VTLNFAVLHQQQLPLHGAVATLVAAVTSAVERSVVEPSLSLLMILI